MEFAVGIDGFPGLKAAPLRLETDNGACHVFVLEFANGASE